MKTLNDFTIFGAIVLIGIATIYFAPIVIFAGFMWWKFR